MAGFYFRHDFNASKDPKLQEVRMSLGSEGYGVYWLLLEELASNASHMLSTDYNKLGWELHLDAGKLKRVVCDYGLFKLTEDGGLFYSERLKNELDTLDEVRQKRSEAGKKGMSRRWGKQETDNGVITNVIGSDNKVITNDTIFDNRKEKKRKDKIIGSNTSNQENNLNIIPTAIGAEQMNLPHASGEKSENQEEFQLQGDSEQTPIEQPQLSGFKIILSDGTFYEVTVAELEEWRKLYPGVDIEQELRNMQGWSDSNQRKRKTRRGVRSFITNWLTKEQDRCGSRAGCGLPPIRRNGEPVPTSKRPCDDPTDEGLPF
ncbi:MAG: DUF4373 domain-containing protein [Thermoguttaceae bacterium]|nr:DUF4373 domain-containing protein [Thermoguttaceae bacterium]